MRWLLLSVLIASAASSSARLPEKTADLVIYEVNFRAFSQGTNFAGVTARLENLKRLGVNTLWLMPIFPTGKINSGTRLGSPYSVSNYRVVNPEFGDMASLKHLVAKAHQLGLAVILDWVANHTAWDNPWISEHPDWYLHDAQGRISIPPGTNYHDVAQLEFKRSDMRKEMIACMEHWIDAANIDGFRCDMADAIPSSFWKSAIAQLRSHSRKRLLMLAEGTKGEHFREGFDLVYAWSFCTALKDVFKGASAQRLAKTDAAEKAPGGQVFRYITNHDECAWEGSPVQLYRGPKGAFAAYVIATSMGGAALIYTGQEIGWADRISFFDHNPVRWPKGSQLEAEYERYGALRRAHPALREGEIEDFSTDDVVAFSRRSGAEKLFVVVNVRPFESTLEAPTDLQGAFQDLWTSKVRSFRGEIRLRSFEWLILRGR